MFVASVLNLDLAIAVTENAAVPAQAKIGKCPRVVGCGGGGGLFLLLLLCFFPLPAVLILPGTLATHGLPNPPTPTRNPLRLTPPAVKKALFKARPRFARRFMKVIKRERPEAFQEYVERRGCVPWVVVGTWLGA